MARAYGKTPRELRELLQRDATLRLDRSGRLFFLDPPAARPHSGLAASATPWARESLAPLDQTFSLHSKPGADKTIYLNFVGRTLSGTAWNTMPSFVVPPFDMDRDNDPDRFSDDERITIQYAWQQVAEDYAPFDVDVTTAAVPPERLAREGPGDSIFGNEVLFVPFGADLACACSAAAFMGSFFDTTESFKPALVFYDRISVDPIYVANAASRAVGHSLGLSADGTSTSELYEGQGSSTVNGWQPIMGGDAWHPLSQFSKGEYADASNREDDFAVIQANGLALRADDVGNSPAEALPLPVESAGSMLAGSFDGILTAEADRDVFALSAGKGRLVASVSPAAVSPNADLVLTLRDSAGTLVAASDPPENLGAGLEQQIATAGTYFLEVRGTGEGDPLQTGYSAYGSVGAYRLSVSHAPRVPPVAAFAASPALGTAPLDVSLDGSASTSDGRVTHYAWDFGDGTGTAGPGVSSTRKTFSLPGTYAVTLRVTDDSGLTSGIARNIVVKDPPGPRVQKVDVRLTGSGRKQKARATVSVVDATGKPTAKAVVMASWSGAVSGVVSGRTGRTGDVVFNSPAAPAGCFRLTVTALKIGTATQVQPPASFGESCR